MSSCVSALSLLNTRLVSATPQDTARAIGTWGCRDDVGGRLSISLAVGLVAAAAADQPNYPLTTFTSFERAVYSFASSRAASESAANTIPGRVVLTPCRC